MATTTTNFGWDIPQSTDLVKNGATAIAELGQDIDTSMAGLKGGTTGQILSKTSNTDMAFTWIANDQGDITAVTAGTGISGGGTTGAVTITNSMATAIDAKGDIVAGTGADTFARLPVGTNGYILSADSAQTTGLNWIANPSKVKQIVVGSTTTGAASSSTTFADTNLTATITPTSSSSKILVILTHNGTRKQGGDTYVGLKLVRGSTSLVTFDFTPGFTANTGTNGIGTVGHIHLDSPATTSATTYKTQFNNGNAAGTTLVQADSATSTILLMEVDA